MSLISSLVTRENGKIIKASWFNNITNALLQLFGLGATGESKITINNAQSTWTTLSGINLDGSKIGSAYIEYTIYRFDGVSTHRRETGHFIMDYDSSTEEWAITERRGTGNALNIDEEKGGLRPQTTDKIGTVEYKSDDMGGGTHHYFTIRIVRTFNIEVSA